LTVDTDSHLIMTAIARHEPGTRLGSYEIRQLLGVGGMASVYEARHKALGKRVAIKVLHEHLAANEVSAARFLREGRAAAAIRHPNVVEVFEVGIHDGVPFLVMELLEGSDLASHLRTHGPLSPPEAIAILLPTASAIAAAHAAGVVHRDLKPRNIFLAREPPTGLRPKVVDFGISKLSQGEEDRALTATESLLGTLEYMAPEQARSAKNADERSDQYALGVILYESLTGQKPFEGGSAYELLHAIVTAPFATPRSMGVPLDPALESVILRAMRRDPQERFDSVASMGRALLPLASQQARAMWSVAFEANAGADVHAASGLQDSATAAYAGQGERTVTHVGTTVPESMALDTDARRVGSRLSRAWPLALFAVASVAVGTSALRSRLRLDSPTVGAPAATTSPSPSVLVGANAVEPELATAAPEVRDRTSAAADAPEAPPSPRRSVRPLQRPAVAASAVRAPPERPLGESAPLASPAPSASSTGVERGFNGAPIVE
jgi:serine/threonine-protein kinase